MTELATTARRQHLKEWRRKKKQKAQNSSTDNRLKDIEINLLKKFNHVSDVHIANQLGLTRQAIGLRLKKKMSDAMKYEMISAIIEASKNIEACKKAKQLRYNYYLDDMKIGDEVYAIFYDQNFPEDSGVDCLKVEEFSQYRVWLEGCTCFDKEDFGVNVFFNKIEAEYMLNVLLLVKDHKIFET